MRRDFLWTRLWTRLWIRRSIPILAALCLAACSNTAEEAAAPESDSKDNVASVRLYIFDCGQIDNVDATRFGLTDEEIAVPDFVTPCYLVVHPQGTLMWDVGQVPDKNFAPGQTVATQGNYDSDTPLLPQLAEIGYTPADIDYLAMSHYHGDHTANANEFAGSTWLVQQPEHDAMFGGDLGDYGNAELFSELEHADTVILNGDHDVFGDGTVVLKSTPGHTPGHQSLFINFANTGPVLLSGDLYHYPEERTLNRIPTIDTDGKATAASREKMEEFMQETGAQLWIQHDKGAWPSRKLSPEFYD